MALLVDAQHIVNGTGNGADGIVLYLVMDSIEPANGIDRLQRA